MEHPTNTDILQPTSLKRVEKPFRYPGSRPFESNERNQFFGRKHDIHKLLNFVELENLVVMYSKSGLGKTSLINAGLLPKMKELNLLPFDIKKEKQSKKNQKYGPFIDIRFNEPEFPPKKWVIKALEPYLENEDLFQIGITILCLVHLK